MSANKIRVYKTREGWAVSAARDPWAEKYTCIYRTWAAAMHWADLLSSRPAYRGL